MMRVASPLKQRPFLLAAEGVNNHSPAITRSAIWSFYVDPGELRTVIGPNGAGKTTFLDLITGRTRPDAGVDHL
jgi:urea transport system ATP-binding protein